MFSPILPDRARNQRHLRLAVCPGVASVGDQCLDLAIVDCQVAAAVHRRVHPPVRNKRCLWGSEGSIAGPIVHCNYDIKLEMATSRAKLRHDGVTFQMSRKSGRMGQMGRMNYIFSSSARERQ
jgi:hypothetical protein